MKKITLFLFALSISIVSFSQVVVNITSAPCNTGLEGTYQYTYAGELDGSSTDWNTPNMYDVNNAVSGPLEMIDDGTSGIAQNYITSGGVGPHPVPPLNSSIPASALGCDTLGNLAQDLSGKVAVVYRGACNFSLKAYNAQKRGAIGVIIINHTGDPIFMGSGALGIAVTIPVVMISRVAGDDLFLALQSCGSDTITGFIGSKVGLYANDMGTTMGDVLMPNELARPKSLSQNGNDFSVDLGFWVFNYGTNNQNSVTGTVNVVRNSDGTTVYTQTSLPLNFNAPSGYVVDSQYVDLGVYSPTYWITSIYSVTYSIDNSNDEDMIDNTFSFDFNIHNFSNGFTSYGIYAKSRTNAINQPISSTYRSLNETTIPYDDWEACIVFKDSNSYYLHATGITFSCMPVGNQMDFELVEIRAYEWNDIFTDIYSPPTFNFINQVAQGVYFYDYGSDGDLSGQNIHTFFNTPISLDEDKRYLFCVYTESDSIRIGFDEQIDYKTTINHYKQPIAPVKLLPNGGSDSWNWEGFGPNAIPAISVQLDMTTSVNEYLSNQEVVPYPNPATNLLTLPVRNKVEGKVLVEVFDLSGKLVLSENNTIGNESLKINVSSISNGAYLFKLNFANGSFDQFKVSVNR
ncbi:MAG: PA domain-containing protein [Flavobacteriales bacterium]